MPQTSDIEYEKFPVPFATYYRGLTVVNSLPNDIFFRLAQIESICRRQKKLFREG